MNAMEGEATHGDSPSKECIDQPTIVSLCLKIIAVWNCPMIIKCIYISF